VLPPRLFLPIGTPNRLFLALGFGLGLREHHHEVILASRPPVGSILVPRGKPLEDLDLYRTADFGGKVLRLHYARAEEFACSLGLRGGAGGGVCAVRLRAGEAAVEARSVMRPEEVIPEVLKAHL
jgi:inner membrane protein